MLTRLPFRLLHLLPAILAVMALPGLNGCRLEPADRSANLSALARWEDQRLAPQDSLIAMLEHEDAHVRLAAVRTAGLIGRSDVLPAMIRNLDDKSATVARQAAFSLGLLGDDAAVPELARAAHDRRPATRIAALRGLAHLKHDGTVFLDAATGDDPQEAAVAWDGLRNLAAEVDSSTLRQALLAGLQRKESDVLWRVLRCCERTPWPDLVPAMAPHARSANPQVRVHAYRALGRVDDPAALASVVAGGRKQGKFRDRHRQRVEIALLRALGSLGHFDFRADDRAGGETRDFLVTTLISGAGSPDPHVAETALAAMENVVTDLPLPPEAASQESLLPVWRIRLARAARAHLDRPEPTVRAAAVRAWARLRGAGAGPEIVARMIGEESPRVLAAHLFAASRIHSHPLAILDDFAHVRSNVPPVVRIAALEGLVHLFRERTSSLPQDIGPGYVLDRLTAAAADEDFVVAATGAELLAQYPHRLTLTALAELWDRAAGPEKADLQLAVLGSLRDMGPEILALERPDSTGFNPDHLIDMIRGLLRESFRSGDIRTRYRGREAASATGLLPPELVPTRASLLATLPAFRRSGLQAPLSLPFKAPEVRCITSAGEFVIKLDGKIAPNTCAVFLDLIRQGFYDNLTFHRVVPDFVVQGGCPRGDGWGGPGYTIRSEWSQAIFRRGAVGIAHSGKDTGGSQFFITLSEQPHLNGRYTIFGEITRGMDIVDRITAGDRFRLEIIP